MRNKRFVFFGTPKIAESVLISLEKEGAVPTLIVTNPPRRQGRGMELKDTPVAAFAKARSIQCLTPEKLTDEAIAEIASFGPWDFYLVVAYGKILPKKLLDSINGRVINIHPSLLPAYRGPSPIPSVLLSDDTETGVTIMEIDEQVDHGPIITQASFPLSPDTMLSELEERCAHLGAKLLCDSIDSYVDEKNLPVPQNETLATHTKKISKDRGNLDLISDDWEKWKHYRALGEWLGVYFTAIRRGERIRVKVKRAHWDSAFIIDEVIPENQKPLPFAVFEKWLSS